MRRPFEIVDHDALVRDYPPPPEYFDAAWLTPPDEIEGLQLERLRLRAHATAQVPFFAKRWAEAGFDPADLHSLADLPRAPSYTVHDIRASIDAHPPFGDYQGALPDGARDEPVRVYMSGGTTGASRPTFYTQWDRDVGALLTARALYMQGIRPGDVVMNSWLYGTHNGAWIFDDAFIVEIVDPETGELLPDGELGSICITELYKTGSPQFRYNILDLSCLYPREQCECGSWLRRMAPFAGRADNMVKLRGINVWPEAVGELALAGAGVGPDWFVGGVRVDDMDEMILAVVSEGDERARPALQSAVEARLKDALGVRIAVEIVAPGALDEWTG